MSRFFKSAAFPILIVVVLAFFAQKLIGSSSKSEKQTFGDMIYQLDHGLVQSMSLHEKDNTANVTTTSGIKYTVGYPDAYTPTLIERLAVAAYLHPALRDLHRVLDLPDEPGPGRGVQGDVVRQVARQAHVRGLAQDHVQGRRGGRRSR
jgi:hypothetical protein